MDLCTFRGIFGIDQAVSSMLSAEGGISVVARAFVFFPLACGFDFSSFTD